MNTIAGPVWLDTDEYPFAPHCFATPEGSMHYVDEGQGTPLVFVHGTPTWSFEWRHLIKGLRGQYRCLAPDHLGFGLSDKPTDYAVLRPEDHARRFADWVDHLGLKDITLVVHDFGGPIGLAYALAHPENVRALVLLNTWMWPLTGDSHFETPGKLLGGPVGRLLYERFAFSPRVILPSAYGDKKKLTPALHAQYLQPLPSPETRRSTYALAQSLLGSTVWYASLWEQRERIASLPALVLWGMKDPAFRPQELRRWQELLPSAIVHPFENAGHWPHEEEPKEVARFLEDFLNRIDNKNAHSLPQVTRMC